MRTRPRPHPLARASCPRTGRPPSRASHAVLPGITRTVNRESSDTEAVVRMRHASLRGSASAPRNCRCVLAAPSRVCAWLRRGVRASLPYAFSLGFFSLLKNTVIKEDP